MCDALRSLVSFVQFKKLEKYPSSGVTFNKVTYNTPPWVFFMFINLHNPVDTRLRFNVDTASHDIVRCRNNVETTSCVYGEMIPHRAKQFILRTLPNICDVAFCGNS